MCHGVPCSLRGLLERRHLPSFNAARIRPSKKPKSSTEWKKRTYDQFQRFSGQASALFVYSIVQFFYRRNYLRAYKGYARKERIVFIVEEAQNVFDSGVVSKKLFNRLRKMFSVARNLDLHFILAAQRLRDLNTKIRGRARLFLGCVSLDVYELKD